MGLIKTIKGEFDEAELLCHQDLTEIKRDDGYHAQTIATEYCLRGCTGSAHETGNPDGAGRFCQHNIRRDVHVRVLHMAGMEGIAKALTEPNRIGEHR